MVLKPFSRRVYYYETDKMGIVHHSNYIRWFEETRVDILNQAGLPFEKVEEQGILSPVLGVECEYKLPFRFNDLFFIKAIITDFGGARFSLVYSVYGEDGAVHALGKTRHCFVDMNMRPLRIKKTHPHIYNVYDGICKSGDELYSEE